MDRYMRMAFDEVFQHMDKMEGGPFGAVIVKDGTVVSVAHNCVLALKDPTAHAEVMAIRKACAALSTVDLSDCVLYTTAKPCPMCKGAIQWSGIRTVYYAGDYMDTVQLGFDDRQFDRDFMAMEEKWTRLDADEFYRIIEAFEAYKDRVHY